MLCVITLVLAVGTWFYSENQKQEKSEEVVVVTSFYPMYVATTNLLEGTTGIKLENLSEPETGCLHDFQLTPEDMKLLSTADIFVINGAGAESFMEDVISQYKELDVITATEDFPEKEENMHAWMTPSLYLQEVEKIAEQLINKSPDNKAIIEKNLKTYCHEVEHLVDETKDVKDLLAEKKIDTVVLFSEAYEGLAKELGLSVEYLMDLDEERQISSGEVAEVLSVVKENPDCFIMAEDPYGRDLAEVVTKQQGTKVVFLDTLTRGKYNKNTYIEGMKKNLDAIKELVIHETN